ncbi:MAG: tetratricopeptide repeat protein [Bacteroidota bacterium]
MDRNKEIYEQIDRYLQAQMSEEERLAFEQRIATDPDLASELQLQQDIAGGIRAHHHQKIKKKLDQIHDELHTDTAPSINKRRWLYPLLAVAAIALLLLLVRQSWSGSKTSPEQLYAQFYQSHPVSLASRSTDVDEQILQIDALYKQRAFQTLLPQIEAKLAKIQNDQDTTKQTIDVLPKLLLAAGITHLETGQTQKAVDDFQRIIDTNDPFLKDHALWYLALSRLRQKQIEPCRKALQDLTKNQRADHYEEALQLLKAL